MIDSDYSIEVLGKRVLIEPKESDKISKGGIILPDSVQNRPSQGKVLAIGDEVSKVSVDDQVIYSRMAGGTFYMGNNEYLILQESDIYGILRPVLPTA